MITCGQCPAVKCIAKGPTQGSEDTSNTQSSSNGGLIGGIVGGILGGGLLLCAVGYLFVRRKNRKTGLPIAFQSRMMTSQSTAINTPINIHSPNNTNSINTNNHTSSGNTDYHDNRNTNKSRFTTATMETIASSDTTNQTRQVMSGVIPVTFIPHADSRPGSEYTMSSQLTDSNSRLTMTNPLNDQHSYYTSFATFGRESWKADNPFDDRHSSTIRESVADSVMSQNYLKSEASRRDSMESSVSQQQTAKVAQATQVTRAKPQIMRVNTVRAVDGVSRSGSIKSIKPQVEITKQDPFADVPLAESKKKPTDSVMSAPGDGEITIFWNGT
ncbi:hypothetical protein BDB01DRAFT_232440 [Pilobolus umbonatus]|nr:hypothetical protein BDB01DRAFT_232440 [Pilobolus umbonatus]